MFVLFHAQFKMGGKSSEEMFIIDFYLLLLFFYNFSEN